MQNCEYILEIGIAGPISMREYIIKYTVCDFEAQRAVAFKLRFREPLINRAFVGKLAVCICVSANSSALSAMISSLYIEYGAILFGAIGRAIVNFPNRIIWMTRAEYRALLGPAFEFFQVREPHLNAKINLDLANSVGEVIQPKVRVVTSIADNNVTAS